MTPTEVLLLARARRLAATGAGRELRTGAHLSLREVAESVGVAPNTLWKWEQGQRSPRGSGAVAWAALLTELQRQPA